jgi:hypothetical protein
MSKNTSIADLINYISVDGSGNVVLSTGQLVATQNYVTTAVSNLVASAPSTLDTLNELATALGNDANFATTVATSIGTKLNLSGGTLTGALNGTSALFTDNLRTDTGLGIKYGSFVSTTGYLNLFSARVGSTFTINFKDGTGGFESALSFTNSANRNYTFPNADGTIALTSNLSSYLPLTGGTLTGALSGTSATFNSFVYILGGNPLRIYNTGNGDFGNLTFATATGFTFDKGITSTAASGFIGAYSTTAANDAAVGAYWSGTSGLEIRYNPNSAIGYIQSLYPNVSGQSFGDIVFRQNVGGTQTTRMVIKNNNGNVGIFNTLYGINNIRPGDNGFGGIDFFGNGFGYTYSAKYFTFRSPDLSEAYGLTNDYGPGTSAELSMVGKGSTANLGFYTGTSTSAKMRINANGAVTKPFNPAFRAYYSVNSTWALSNGSTFIFNATEFNIGNCYNTSNGTFTAPVAGVYQFNFYSILLGNYTNGAISFFKNGAAMTSGFNIHFSPPTANAWSNVTYSTLVYLNAGDFVYMINSSGFAINFHGDDWSSFSGYLVG